MKRNRAECSQDRLDKEVGICSIISFAGDAEIAFGLLPERLNRPEKLKKPDKPERRDKPNRLNRPEKRERPDRPDKPERRDRPDRQNRPERLKRPDKPDRPDFGSGPDPCGLGASVRCVIEFPTHSEKGPSKKSYSSGAGVSDVSIWFKDTKRS